MSPVMFNVEDDNELSQGQSPNETPSAFCNNFSAQKDYSNDEDELSPVMSKVEDDNKLSQISILMKHHQPFAITFLP
jgi:hypothetical protein